MRTTNLSNIVVNCIPIALMIVLIPFFKNDYVLTGLYLAIIAVSLVVKHYKKDFLFLVFGFFAMFISEYFFLFTGVETFTRNSLFGLMPLWLPFLWAYVFVVIRRTIVIIEK